MYEYDSKFAIRHRRPICVTQDSLIELSQIMESARIDLIPPPPALDERADDGEDMSDPNGVMLKHQRERYEQESATIYCVGFSSGFRPSKRSIENLLNTLNAEPDAPVEIEFYLGRSYSSTFNVEIGDIYGASVNVKITGPDAGAEATARRIRNWMRLHEPDYPWLRSTISHFFLSATIALCAAFLAVWSNYDAFTQFFINYEHGTKVAAVIVSALLFGTFFTSYALLKQFFPFVEFQLGWSSRRSKVKKTQAAVLISLFAVPILLHIVGLT